MNLSATPTFVCPKECSHVLDFTCLKTNLIHSSASITTMSSRRLRRKNVLLKKRKAANFPLSYEVDGEADDDLHQHLQSQDINTPNIHPLCKLSSRILQPTSPRSNDRKNFALSSSRPTKSQFSRNACVIDHWDQENVPPVLDVFNINKNDCLFNIQRSSNLSQSPEKEAKVVVGLKRSVREGNVPTSCKRLRFETTTMQLGFNRTQANLMTDCNELNIYMRQLYDFDPTSFTKSNNIKLLSAEKNLDTKATILSSFSSLDSSLKIEQSLEIPISCHDQLCDVSHFKSDSLDSWASYKEPDQCLSEANIKLEIDSVSDASRYLEIDSDDSSDRLRLPLIRGKRHDCNSISVKTLRHVLEGKYNEYFDKSIVVDCRYPYEYEAGHIKNAINIFTKEEIVETFIQKRIQNNQNCVIIFHCEFSSERGPRLMHHLRKVDRQEHIDTYPALYYPELYLLDGGYKAFYESFSFLCEPCNYKPMLHQDHLHELRRFSSKSKSWSIGERERSREQSSGKKCNRAPWRRCLLGKTFPKSEEIQITSRTVEVDANRNKSRQLLPNYSSNGQVFNANEVVN